MEPKEKDDHFPGPGAYHQQPDYDGEVKEAVKDAPGFVIKKHESKARERSKNGHALKPEVIGPWTYAPENPSHAA